MASIHPTPYFTTARLAARSFFSGDLDAFVAYRADPEVARYQGWSDYTVEEGRALIDAMANVTHGAPGEWYQFALESADAALVGDVALKVSGEPGEAELGFTLAPEHQGKRLRRRGGSGLARLCVRSPEPGTRYRDHRRTQCPCSIAP